MNNPNGDRLDEIEAAYQHAQHCTEELLGTRVWPGWELHAAFLAGIRYAQSHANDHCRLPRDYPDDPPLGGT